jgi:phosphoglycolate phosphatase
MYTMDGLILFDVDGTLTKGMGHPEAFRHALRTVYGVDAGQPPEGNPGWTDRAIILDVLQKQGLSREDIIGKMDECMSEMARFYKGFVSDHKVETHEGVKGLLEELSTRSVLLGLVTGNVEDITFTKLESAGVAHYFGFGGFGSDHTERPELVKLAIRRAENHGFRPGGKVFVVGDTPRDVEAGKAAGATTIGVATGPFSSDDLRAAGTDFVLNSLAEKERFLGIIG